MQGSILYFVWNNYWFGRLTVVYDRNHYFGLGPIPKPKLVDTFGWYHNRYRNHISKGESSTPKTKYTNSLVNPDSFYTNFTNNWFLSLKFRNSEKATKIWKISNLVLTIQSNFKKRLEIFKFCGFLTIS